MNTPILECWQHHFQGCGHVKLAPRPKRGQRYRVTAFLDYTGRCAECADERQAKRKEPKQRTDSAT